MPLILEVTHYGMQPRKPALQGRFERRGGVIGRSLQSDLCLPDPDRFVSRRHAEVHYHAGGYFITDISGGNPVCLNGTPIARGYAEQLHDGDFLSIGDYQISASLVPDAESVSEGTAQLCNDDNVTDKTLWQPADRVACSDESVNDTFTELLFESTLLSTTEDLGLVHRGSDADALPEIFGEMPKICLLPDPLPDDYDFLQGIAHKPAELSASESKATCLTRTHPQVSIERSEIHCTPGIEAQKPVSVTTDEALKPSPTSALLREFIAGLQTILSMHEGIRSELGINASPAPRANNPLLSSNDVNSTLEALIGVPHDAAVAPATAVTSAYHAIATHEQAMVAGSRAALFSLQSRLNPIVVDQSLGPKTWLDRLLPILRHARSWRAHVERYQGMVSEGSATGLTRYREDFAKAYVEQTRRSQERGQGD